MINIVLRWTLGFTFIFAGWVKAIDPMGFSLKIEEFLFNISLFIELSSVFAIFLSAFELFIGIMLICNIYKKYIAGLTFICMLFFTIITLYLYLSPENGITDCGCFGEAIRLTNGETFIKNIILLGISTLYFVRILRNSKISIMNKMESYIIPFYIAIITFMLPVYSLFFLPVYDYLPFNRGDKIDLHQNTNEYSNEITRLNFIVLDEEYNDITTKIFHQNKRLFFVTFNNIDKINKRDIDKLKFISKISKSYGIKLYIVSPLEIDKLKAAIQECDLENIGFGVMDNTVLKSIIRCNNGLLWVENGTIIGKWNIRNFSFENITLDKLRQSQENIKVNFLGTIILFLSVLYMLFNYKSIIK